MSIWFGFGFGDGDDDDDDAFVRTPVLVSPLVG
jgi:hypothetical protein